MAVSTQSSTVESVTSGGGGDWSSSDEDDYGDYYGGEDGDMSCRTCVCVCVSVCGCGCIYSNHGLRMISGMNLYLINRQSLIYHIKGG